MGLIRCKVKWKMKLSASGSEIFSETLQASKEYMSPVISSLEVFHDAQKPCVKKAR